ncbi:MAG: phage major capsid protein [Clostridia bacterium]|nr:phage major capsid protein [Clostridia bacterium]
MTTFNEKNHLIGTAEYDTNFWNVMRGDRYAADKISGSKDISTGGYALPTAADDRLRKAIRRESLFRNMATVVKAYNSGSRIFAKDCDDLAEWVPENGSIPIYDGVNDFTRYAVEMHKLAVFVKLDDDFVHDATFDIEDYLTGRLAKNFARAEDRGFITGTGDSMPKGILSPTDGAEAGVYTDSITYDDVIRLFFALDDEYRKNAVWLMNDDTALALRLLKDEAGNPLWNQASDTILGKRVVISNDMPSADAGEMPIVFGDFSYYWIIDRSPVSIQTLKEKFVTLDQIGYLALEFLDGRLIRRDALQAMKINIKE